MCIRDRGISVVGDILDLAANINVVNKSEMCIRDRGKIKILGEEEEED